MRKSGWALGILIALGGLLGGVLSAVLRALAPAGPIQTLFVESVSLAVDPPLTLDIAFIKITLGVLFKINLLTLLGVFLGLYLYKNL